MEAAEAARVQAANTAEIARTQAGIAGEMGRVQAGRVGENARMDAMRQQEAARVQQAIEQSRQFGAGQALAAEQAAIGAAGQMGSMGQGIGGLGMNVGSLGQSLAVLVKINVPLIFRAHSYLRLLVVIFVQRIRLVSICPTKTSPVNGTIQCSNMSGWRVSCAVFQ